MKRSGPPQRRTPLKSSNSLKSTKGLTRSAPMKQSAPSRAIKKREKTKAQKAAGRAMAEGGHGIPWQQVREVIYERCGGRCEGCGTPFEGLWGGLQGHHRMRRGIGPDCPCNALAVCAECHHGPTIHAGPELAKQMGRIISTHERSPISKIPVKIHRLGRVLLTCSGEYDMVA